MIIYSSLFLCVSHSSTKFLKNLIFLSKFLKRNMTDDTSENVKEMKKLYSLYHQEYTIMAEYRMLQSENLHGVYVIPSYESSFLWFGVIFVRSGCYEGAVLRFTLTLPENFPSEECPIVTFKSSLYHPAVNANTGVLNLSEVFPQWDRTRNHIWQILKYIHWIFYNLNIKAPANTEAALLYKTNKKLFMEKVKECVVACIDRLYDEPPTDDKHYITFAPYDSTVHDPIKVAMLKPPSPNSSVTGLSWVKPGTFQPFSADEENT